MSDASKDEDAAVDDFMQIFEKTAVPADVKKNLSYVFAKSFLKTYKVVLKVKEKYRNQHVETIAHKITDDMNSISRTSRDVSSLLSQGFVNEDVANKLGHVMGGVIGYVEFVLADINTPLDEYSQKKCLDVITHIVIDLKGKYVLRKSFLVNRIKRIAQKHSGKLGKDRMRLISQIMAELSKLSSSN